VSDEDSQSEIRFIISLINTPTSVPTTCKIDNRYGLVPT